MILYQDLVIKDEDLALLEEGAWLNDILIDFGIQHFIAKLDAASKVKVLNCGMVHLLKMVEDIDQILPVLPSLETDLLLLPFNNNTSIEAGGTHWSLLAYSNGEYRHLDSMEMNNPQSFVKKLQKILPGKLVSVRCTQQSNGSDCGIHVILNAERVICEAMNREYQKITPTEKRKRIFTALHEL